MSFDAFDFEEIFDEDYLHFFAPDLAAASDAESQLIWRLLELEPGDAVLDLACGHGRIANPLAAAGARVSGLDATSRFIERGRPDAAARGLAVEYVEGDMRTLPWPDESFDGVVSWFTSFGYFGDDENRGVLAEAHRVLRPGGRLLIEANNLVALLARWRPESVIERDGDFVIDRRWLDPTSGRALTERVVVRDGRVRRFRFSVRMFLAVELGDWLRQAGFVTVGFYDEQGEPLTAEGRRMIAVAER